MHERLRQLLRAAGQPEGRGSAAKNTSTCFRASFTILPKLEAIATISNTIEKTHSWTLVVICHGHDPGNERGRACPVIDGRPRASVRRGTLEFACSRPFALSRSHPTDECLLLPPDVRWAEEAGLSAVWIPQIIASTLRSRAHQAA